MRRGFSEGALFTIENAGHDGSMFQSSPELIEAINRFIAGAPISDQRFKALPLHFPCLEIKRSEGIFDPYHWFSCSDFPTSWYGSG
jgi:hypothetical protein